ncbi:MAG: hypothetical protein HND40_10360 [Ignavibacteriota bacterium]|nr:MAG: hypothetical protein HND40_10360 [Ignavibacteriota bacterium]
MERTSGELERLSELRISYYDPASVDIDPLLFKLSGGDISKTNIINDLEVEYCYDWYYLIKVSELNEMRLRIAEWKKHIK